MKPLKERTPAKSHFICRGRFSLFAALAVMAVMLAGVVLLTAGQVHAAAGQGAGPINPKRYEGRWVRSDGNYFLEVKEIRKDGSLQAAYFNPRPVKVAKAELRFRDGKTALVVELRDINYPGSTYTLRYDPAGDRLTGTYFQAVEKQTYDIEFMRYK